MHAFGRHMRAADAGKSYAALGRSPDRGNQRGAEPVAGLLARHQKDMRAASLPRCSSRGSGGRADDENIGAVRRRHHLLRLGDDGGAGHDRNARKSGARDPFDRPRTDRGQIEAPILSGLGRLHQNAAAGRRAQRGRWRATRRRGRASGRCLPPPPPPAHACRRPPPPGRHRTARWRADSRSQVAISARSRSDACTRPSVPSGISISGATSCAPSRRKPSSSNSIAHAGQQMVVAAAKRRDHARQHRQRLSDRAGLATAMAAPAIR